MKALIPLLLFPIGLTAQDPQGKDPAVAVADLRHFLAGRDHGAAIAAIERHGLVADAAVVKLLGNKLFSQPSTIILSSSRG